MSIIISVRNGNISDTTKSYAEKRAQAILDEYNKITSIRVILNSEKARFEAEVILRGKNINLESDQESYDIYESIDMAMDKVSTQLRRHLDKIQDHNKPVKQTKKEKDGDNLEEIEGVEEFIDA